MRASRRIAPAGLLFALLLSIALLAIAWLALRAAVVEIMPPGDLTAARLSPGAPDVVLNRAMIEFVTKRGALSETSMGHVGEAAQRAPLDARPYLFVGARDIVQRHGAHAVLVLEAGRRLNGRDRWIRLLLLDRYLRTGRYADAITEFAVLNRLVTGAQGPILAELSRMSLSPATRDAVRRTLAQDPTLELDLLVQLARNNPDPRLLWSLASPGARAAATRAGGWGQALVETLVERRRYAAARATWTTLFHIPAPAAAAPVYNAGFQALPGSPPFGWQYAGGTIGAADARNHQLEIEYYGRDDGTLASQLLMLAPGRYRLGYKLTGNPGSSLGWSVSCAEQGTAAPFAQLPLPATTNQVTRVAVEFTVPTSGCAAQWLRLAGSATEFPTSVNITLSELNLRREETRP